LSFYLIGHITGPYSLLSNGIVHGSHTGPIDVRLKFAVLKRWDNADAFILPEGKLFLYTEFCMLWSFCPFP